MIFQNPISGLVSFFLCLVLNVQFLLNLLLQNGLGIFLALVGSGYYGWVRYQERIASK